MPRGKATCPCCKCNRKIVEIRTRKEHMRLEKIMEDRYGSGSKPVSKRFRRDDDNDKKSSNSCES